MTAHPEQSVATMPPTTHLHARPGDREAHEVKVLEVTAEEWERRPEAGDPAWCPVRWGGLVRATRVLFPPPG